MWPFRNIWFGSDALADDEPDKSEHVDTMHVAPAHLVTRVASALLLIPLALAAVWLGGLPFAVLLALGGLAMSVEWSMMIAPRRRERLLFLGLAAVVALGFVRFAGQAPSILWIGAVGGLGLVLLLGGLIFRIVRMSWFGVALLYCWIPVYALMWLRAAEDGRWMVAWLLLVVWGTDIGGYFVGRAVGGAKLAPRISPNKTWAGLGGGMALAALAGAVGAWWFQFDGLAPLAFAAAGLAIVGQIGDIAESAVKRHFGVKDSSHLIPGHGGILDRVDGLVFAAPVMAIAVAILESVKGAA